MATNYIKLYLPRSLESNAWTLYKSEVAHTGATLTFGTSSDRQEGEHSYRFLCWATTNDKTYGEDYYNVVSKDKLPVIEAGFNDEGYNLLYNFYKAGASKTVTESDPETLSYYAVYTDVSTSQIVPAGHGADYTDKPGSLTKYADYIIDQVAYPDIVLKGDYFVGYFKFAGPSSITLDPTNIHVTAVDESGLSVSIGVDNLIKGIDGVYYVFYTGQFDEVNKQTCTVTISGLADSEGYNIKEVSHKISPPNVIRDINENGDVVAFFNQTRAKRDENTTDYPEMHITGDLRLFGGMVYVGDNGDQPIDGSGTADEALKIAQRADRKSNQNASDIITINDVATTAQDKSFEAEETSAEAKVISEDAQATANEAKTSAEIAKESADSAVESATIARTQAEEATASATLAQEKAQEASENADRAYEAAEQAIDDASRAQTAAETAEGNAQTALNQANIAERAASEAVESATTANHAAGGALTSLSVVEDVVGTLNWISEHATYKLTADTEVVPGKHYFTKDGDNYNIVVNPTGNPSEAGYYEIDTIDEAVSNYVASHLSLTDEGLWILCDTNAYKILLASDGMYVYDNLGVFVSKFGESIDFSSTRPQYIGGEEAFIIFYDSDDDGIPDAIDIGGSKVTIGRTKKLSDVLTDLDISTQRTPTGAEITIGSHTVTINDGQNGTTISKVQYSKDGTNWTYTEPTVTKGDWLYIKITYTDNTYTITKSYMGTDGEDGQSIYIVSATKVDGKTTVVFSDGTSMEIDDGEDGSQGIPGQPGTDGRTSYTHFAWANSSDGSEDFSTTDSVNKKYIGVYSDFTPEDSYDPDDYSWTLTKGEKGIQGEPGEPGTSIDSIQYSLNGEEWSTEEPVVTKGDWLYIKTNYSDGTYAVTKSYMGTDGQDGTSVTITSSVKVDGVTVVTFSDGSTIRIVDGEDGAQGTPGEPGEDGRTSYVHFAWANSADGSQDFSPTVSANKKYIGVYHDFEPNDSYDPEDYSWTLTKGEKGEDGEDGQDGQDGTTIDKIEYSKDGTNWSTTQPSLDQGDWLYVRTSYTDGTSATSKSYVGTDGEDGTSVTIVSSVKTDGVTIVTFSDGSTMRIVDGEDGSDGQPGQPGSDGRTSYTHFAWANSSDGTVDFSTTDSTNKLYIGVYSDFTQADSQTPSDYSWTLTKGEQGQDGQDGQDGKDGKDGKDGTTIDKIEYSKDGITWSEIEPTLSKGDWLYVRTTYTDGTSGTSKSYVGTDGQDGTSISIVSSTKVGDVTTVIFSDGTQVQIVDGEDGSDGQPGAPGTDGRTSYTHFAWANSADGTVDFSTTDSTNKLYIGVYSDFTQADSQTPSDYSWTLTKGAKGDNGTSISVSSITYAVSQTDAQPDDSEFHDPPIPSVPEGQWLWSRTTYSDNNKLYTKAKQGAKGADGVSIDTVEEWYARNNSSTQAPVDSDFGTDVLNPTATEKYVWNFEKIKDVDGNVITTTNKRIVANYAADGGPGDPGRSIASIINYYARSQDPTAPSGTGPSATWTTTPWALDADNKYMWNYEVITYSNPSSTESTAKRIIAVYGDTGDNGNSILGTYKFYRLGTTAPGSPTLAEGRAFINSHTVPTGWSTNEPAYTSGSTDNLYVCELTHFSYPEPDDVQWSIVTQAASFEAAKQAYTKANQAKVTADDVATNTGQYFWSDGSALHMATEADTPNSTYNSLWNSLGMLFRRAGDTLLSITTSAFTFFSKNQSGRRLLEIRPAQGSDDGGLELFEDNSFNRSLAKFSTETRIGLEKYNHLTLNSAGMRGWEDDKHSFFEIYSPSEGDFINIDEQGAVYFYYNSANRRTQYSTGLGKVAWGDDFTVILIVNYIYYYNGTAHIIDQYSFEDWEYLYKGTSYTGTFTAFEGETYQITGGLYYNGNTSFISTCNGGEFSTDHYYQYNIIIRADGYDSSPYYNFGNTGAALDDEGQPLPTPRYGRYSLMSGDSTLATGECSSARGFSSTATSFTAVAEGNNCTASGTRSRAVNCSTTAEAWAAHASGCNTHAAGRRTNSNNGFTFAYGNDAFAANRGTIASGTAQTVFGRFNVEDTNDEYALIVGGGNFNPPSWMPGIDGADADGATGSWEDEPARITRKNIMTLDWDGKLTLQGHDSPTGTVITNTVSANRASSTDLGNLSGAYIDVPAGSWIITLECDGDLNSANKRLQFMLYNSTDGTEYSSTKVTLHTSNTGAVAGQTTLLINISAQKRFYCRCYQNSGATVSLNARFRAMRIA